MNPICLLKALWRSMLTQRLVSGHNYETAKEKTPPNVHVLVCRTCGKCDVFWSWKSLENQK